MFFCFYFALFAIVKKGPVDIHKGTQENLKIRVITTCVLGGNFVFSPVLLH